MPMSRIRELRFAVLAIPFKVAFRHASAERAETSSVWVESVSEGGVVGRGESCPRPYVTGETIDSAQAFFSRHQAVLCAHVVDLDSLRSWMAERREELDVNPAAWCAIELAILEMLAIESRVPIEGLLALPRLAGRFQYSAVLGDMSHDAFQATAGQYRRQGFTDFKVKLSGNLDRDREKMALLRHWPGIRVRVDANNLWRTADDAIRFLQALDYPLSGVEEPIEPGKYAALAGIGARLRCKMILDESFLRASQIDQLAADADAWIINLRVSKMGGLLRSLEVAGAARKANVGLIVGAQVGETSVLTRAALAVAHASRDILVAQEGAFGTLLLERDVCDPSLTFGAGGILDVAAYPALERPGFGLSL
jgi:L-alanine-DL-glutamate epimerase-like enolase superfamily enzyme